MILAATSRKQSTYRYLFLFNDILLATKPKRMGKLYHFKRFFNLAVTRFDDVADSLGTSFSLLHVVLFTHTHTHVRACVRWCVCGCGVMTGLGGGARMQI